MGKRVRVHVDSAKSWPIAVIEHQATSKSNHDSKTCLETIGVFLYDSGKLTGDRHRLTRAGNVE